VPASRARGEREPQQSKEAGSLMFHPGTTYRHHSGRALAAKEIDMHTRLTTLLLMLLAGCSSPEETSFMESFAACDDPYPAIRASFQKPEPSVPHELLTEFCPGSDVLVRSLGWHNGGTNGSQRVPIWLAGSMDEPVTYGWQTHRAADVETDVDTESSWTFEEAEPLRTSMERPCVYVMLSMTAGAGVYACPAEKPRAMVSDAWHDDRYDWIGIDEAVGKGYLAGSDHDPIVWIAGGRIE
jgi:hypothetical protein